MDTDIILNQGKLDRYFYLKYNACKNQLQENLRSFINTNVQDEEKRSYISLHASEMCVQMYVYFNSLLQPGLL